MMFEYDVPNDVFPHLHQLRDGNLCGIRTLALSNIAEYFSIDCGLIYVDTDRIAYDVLE